jgi:hypothetical protein
VISSSTNYGFLNQASTAKDSRFLNEFLDIEVAVLVSLRCLMCWVRDAKASPREKRPGIQKGKKAFLSI